MEVPEILVKVNKITILLIKVVVRKKKKFVNKSTGHSTHIFCKNLMNNDTQLFSTCCNPIPISLSFILVSAYYNALLPNHSITLVSVYKNPILINHSLTLVCACCNPVPVNHSLFLECACYNSVPMNHH